MNLKQIIILALGVACLAGGIGYVVTSFSGSRSVVDEGGGTPRPKAPLEFVSDFSGTRNEEAFTAGYHPFRYKSRVDTPTLVGVNWKNCKCASVEICIAPDEWKALEEEQLAKKAEDPSLKWVPLAQDGTGFSIPGKAIGWVRVGWKADKSGEERFKADLWLHEPDSGIGFPLEVAVSFVPAVRVRWEEDQDRLDAYVGRMGAGDQRQAKFLVWSSTREKFSLKPDPPRVDPCINYGEPMPLAQGELEGLGQRHGRKALSGYRVVITVSERVGENQLDLGPVRRQVAWKAEGIKEPITAHVNGIILGEVVALLPNKPDDPRLDMGSINPERPPVVKIRLESDYSTVELAPDDKTTDFVKVELLDGKEGVTDPSTGRKSWRANVSYRPESGFRGRFPDAERAGYESCSVVFRITHAGAQNEQPRRIKVPITGHVKEVKP
jgi:hypothetical protein